MLQNLNKTTNVNASSSIDGKTVMHMTAVISASGTVNINQSVIDMTTYSSNQEECDVDYEQFKEKVFEIAGA